MGKKYGNKLFIHCPGDKVNAGPSLYNIPIKTTLGLILCGQMEPNL